MDPQTANVRDIDNPYRSTAVGGCDTDKFAHELNHRMSLELGVGCGFWANVDYWLLDI